MNLAGSPLGWLRARGLVSVRQLDAALVAAGSELADILWRTVCACKSMPDAERALGWPARSGRLVLGMALDRIADYYRIQGENDAAPDYRQP